MGNNWKMRCVDVGTTEGVYTVGKVYVVENNIFKNDKGMLYDLHLHGCFDIDCFNDWQEISDAKWELVEDKMTIQEKIKKAEAKIAKWQGKLDALKQQEQAEKPLTGWEVPKRGAPYFWIQSTGDVLSDRCRNSTVQKDRFENLAAFSTQTKALEIANAELAYRTARKFADEWEGQRDINTLWQVYYNRPQKALKCSAYSDLVGASDIFPSCECAKAFIDQHGKEYAMLLGWELEG